MMRLISLLFDQYRVSYYRAFLNILVAEMITTVTLNSKLYHRRMISCHGERSARIPAASAEAPADQQRQQRAPI